MEKIKVRLEYLPDGYLNIYEIKEGVSASVASWSPDNFPDRTERSIHNEGSIYNKVTKERIIVKANKREWLNKVKELYDFDNDTFLASSWRGGGLLHRRNVTSFIFPKQDENKAIHAWYEHNPSKNKLVKKEHKKRTRKSNSNSVKQIR
jgi:hypothetical protein